MLLEFTDAHIIVVLDRVQEAAEPWNAALRLAAAGDLNQARRVARGIEGRGTSEERVLGAMCRAAIDHKRWNRLSFFGLSRADIIEYLPLQAFGLDSAFGSWDEAVESWKQSRSRSRDTGDFKAWLRAEFGAQISAETMREGARTLAKTEIPDDLLNLASAIRDAAYPALYPVGEGDDHDSAL
jgi:hypothetical protein